jgi:hypothetical protein
MKETVELTYELCVQLKERWQALGRNYTAVQKADDQNGGPGSVPAHIVFHLLDMNTVDTGIRVTVKEGCAVLTVEFPPFRGRYSNKHAYRMNAVPVQPFRDEERVKVWEEFIDAVRTPCNKHTKISL